MNGVKTGDLVICTSYSPGVYTYSPPRFIHPAPGKMYQVSCYAFLPGAIYVRDPFCDGGGPIWMLEAHQFERWENRKREL